MVPITSRRHPVNFYLTLVLCTLFFLGMAIFMIDLAVTKSRQGKPETPLIAIFAVGLFFIAIYSIWRYIKNTPRIVIEEGCISFNADSYSLADITKIEFTGKRDFPYLFRYEMEAATLYFHDGQQKVIFDEMYENAWELKSCLQKIKNGKSSQAIQEYSTVDRTELESEMYTTYKGNQFTSLRGISLWSLTGIFLFALFKIERINSGIIVFMVLFLLFWYTVHAWLMHYFEVSDGFLVVRNHILPWKRKGYRLADIKEVVFETRQKMPVCLRIITKDFKSKLYPAGTLRTKTWHALKDKLRSERIKVRNECV